MGVGVNVNVGVAVIVGGTGVAVGGIGVGVIVGGMGVGVARTPHPTENIGTHEATPIRNVKNFEFFIFGSFRLNAIPLD